MGGASRFSQWANREPRFPRRAFPWWCQWPVHNAEHVLFLQRHTRRLDFPLTTIRACLLKKWMGILFSNILVLCCTTPFFLVLHCSVSSLLLTPVSTLFSRLSDGDISLWEEDTGDSQRAAGELHVLERFQRLFPIHISLSLLQASV